MIIKLDEINELSLSPRSTFFGCEGNLAATSVTPLIARLDSADLVG